MTDIQALTEQGRELYSRGATQALGGFQLIEELLKSYIDVHHQFARAFIGGRLHFDFARKDYENSALEKLVGVFSKICDNKDLVKELRSSIDRRNHLAHRALLKMYDQNLSPGDYMELINQAEGDMAKNSALMEQIRGELAKLGQPG